MWIEFFFSDSLKFDQLRSNLTLNTISDVQNVLNVLDVLLSERYPPIEIMHWIISLDCINITNEYYPKIDQIVHNRSTWI